MVENRFCMGWVKPAINTVCPVFPYIVHGPMVCIF